MQQKAVFAITESFNSVFMHLERKPTRTCKIETNYYKMNYGPDF